MPDDLPPLQQDRAFWGMTVTQFLGAFNDNLFKQLVLLIGTDYVMRRELDGDPYQAVAGAMFAIPFILFSGFGGFLADRISKRTVVVACKVLEIAVMAAGVLVFFLGTMGTDGLINGLFFVLFLMGVQSAFFGPAKYGILPEMLEESDLPNANGIIQMTTFLAIIFGTALAGLLKESLGDDGQLWIVSGVCVGIAAVGTGTSLLVRKTPIAEPGLKFTPSALGINRPTIDMLRADRMLLGVLLISSLFWFLGGVILPTVNSFGKLQLGASDTQTSLLATCMGVGIAVGCAAAARLSRGRVRFGLVTGGAAGMTVSLLLLAVIPLVMPTLLGVKIAAAAALVSLGFCAGLFAVPLQVFLQARPSKEQKGRMIGTMNLINWVGILIAQPFYGLCSGLFDDISWTFALLAVILLPVAIWYRPQDSSLGQSLSS